MINVIWITRFYSWTQPLINLMNKHIQLHVIIPEGNSEYQEDRSGVKYYFLGLQTPWHVKRMSSSLLDRYKKIINEVKPQIIHVHGTEYNFAQIQDAVPNIPVVISIQGILSGCIPFTLNYISKKEIRPYKTIKNILGRGGYDLMQRKCINGSKRFEKDILTSAKYFFCRTKWDKAWISLSNPRALIYHGEEILRDAFYNHSGEWNINKCHSSRIFMTSGFNPMKGLHIAIKAIALLKESFPNIKLVVPGVPNHILNYGFFKSRIIGEEYINYVKSLISINGLKNNIELLPNLNEEEMAVELIKANLFLSPTSIDNSPNSIGEAMIIGTPIIASPVGGVPSMLSDNDSCLFSPAGDEYILAFQIKQLLEDKELAERLSHNAHFIAEQRHDRENTLNQYIEAYQNIIDIHKKNN